MIKCQKCGTEIPLTEALTGQIEQSIRAKYEQDAFVLKRKIQEHEAGLASREQAINDREAAQEEAIASRVAQSLKSERSLIEADARKKVLAEQQSALAASQADLAAKDSLIAQMRQAELDLRRPARENADKVASAELEAIRKLDAERAAIKQEAARLADEANALKIREKDNLLAQMSEQLEAMKRKAETGSQEAQGEAQEDILIETLSRTFPYDAFDEVVKGAKGGDVVQTVRNATGKNCGRILWESKNTKAFSKQWISKVQEDQMRVNATLSVICTVTLPDEFNDRGVRFGLYEGIWITDLKSAMPLTAALRQGIIEADKQRVVSTNQESLQALLYEYLTSKDAQMRIRAVIDAGNKMTDDLNKERNAMERLWAARQKNIENLTRNFTGFFGAMEGIVGRASLPAVPDPVASLTDGL